jgi:NAD(P)-dependent dehydrogenase (short-subunit alcohol dehydrogenase family)
MNRYPSLKDRVVVITGGGRGLGQVMALALVEQGARVMITAARQQGELDDTVAQAKALGSGDMRAMLADVTSEADCQAVVAATLDAYGRIDVLINNAGRAATEGLEIDMRKGIPKFWEADAKGYASMVDINFTGPFLMTRAAAPPMVQAGFGKVINISTSLPNMTRQSGTPYGQTKTALEAASVTWAKDVEGTGVTVNVLLPGGPADTALIPGVVGGRSIPGFKPGKGPLGLEGQAGMGLLPPSVMTAPCLWMCSDESNAYNGRRVVGRDWDPEIPFDQAVSMAMQDKHDAPQVM